MKICRQTGVEVTFRCFIAIVIAVALTAIVPAAEPLSVGVAMVDITPPLGYRMAGYYNERRNTGTHDPLLAKAAVFQQGDVRAALVECDLVSMPAEVSSKARDLAEKHAGVPARHMVVSATHSHTGPLPNGSPRPSRWPRKMSKKSNSAPARARKRAWHSTAVST